MGSEARELIETNGVRTMMDRGYTTALAHKWAPMLEGLDNGYTKKVTAMLLENEMDHLKSLSEDTLSTNAGSFTKYIFPILRRVFPNLIANRIVSIQPMSAPVGGVFYYDYKYGNRKGTKNPVQGAITNNPYDMAYDGELAAGDPMIKNFATDYTSEYVDYDVVCTDDGTSTTGALTQASANCRALNWLPVRAPATLGQLTFAVSFIYRDATPATRTATADALGNLTDDLGNSVGTVNFTTGAWSLNASAGGGGSDAFQDNKVIYVQYWYNSELVETTTGGHVPSGDLDIQLQTIVAEPFKIRANWSAEAVDDLRALHGLDAEAELVAGFSNEMGLEIDRKIIRDLINGAAHVATYAHAYDQANKPHTEIDSIRAILTQIEALSAAIHKTSHRAPANFMVVSPQLSALISQLTSHMDYSQDAGNVVTPSYGPMTANFGIVRIGTLMHKYAVYVDPYMTAGQCLVGLRGNGYLDAGYAYSPYVPLQVTPTFYDPDTFRFKKGLRSRGAFKMLRPEYYGVLTVTGLPTVTTTIP